LVPGVAFKKFIQERLPQKIMEQMHTVDLTGKTDQVIITIIINADRKGEKWDAARKNLRLKVSLRSHEIQEKSDRRSSYANNQTSSQYESGS
jgi:hypothetical protein